MADTYSLDLQPGWADLDTSGRLRPSVLCSYLQEAAGRHAEILGVGRDLLVGRGQAWMLSRIRVDLRRRPGLDGPVRVGTWPRGSEGPYFIRDYSLSDQAGAFGVARSLWLMIQLPDLRPVRPQAAGVHIPENADQNEPITQVPKAVGPALEDADPATYRCKRTASYSDLDVNGHVNNARYVEWCWDALLLSLLDGPAPLGPEAANELIAGLEGLTLYYASETRPGEAVDILVRQETGGFSLAGYRADGRLSFAASLSNCRRAG